MFPVAILVVNHLYILPYVSAHMALEPSWRREALFAEQTRVWPLPCVRPQVHGQVWRTPEAPFTVGARIWPLSRVYTPVEKQLSRS